MFIAIARSFVDGQCNVELQHVDHNYIECEYRVVYGEENNVFKGLGDALNNYKQCVLHQETCAGWHDE